MNRLVKHDLVRGLKDVVFEKDKLCSSSQAGKQVRNTHPKKSIMITLDILGLLQTSLVKLLSCCIWICLGQHNTLASVEINMAL